MTGRAKKAGLAALCLAVLAGCGYSVPADMVAIQVGAGPIEGSPVKGCKKGGDRQHWFQTNDSYHLLPGPTNQREWDATGQDGSDSPAFESVTQDAVVMRIPMTVRFTLKSGDCDSIKALYQNFIRRYGISFNSKGEGNKEWDLLVRKLVGDPTDYTLDRIVQGYAWRKLWNDPKVKVEIEQKLTAALNDPNSLIVQTAKGSYFEGFSVIIGQPSPAQQALADAVALEQTNVAKAQSEKAQAEADAAKARAQVAVAEAEAAKKRAEIAGYKNEDTYLKNKLIERGGNPFQPSYGPPTTPTGPSAP